MSSALISTEVHGRPRVKPCCLLIEDQVLIGMSLEAYLGECGWDVVGPLSSNAEAAAWLRQNTPDLAIVDFTLRDGPCTPLARELRERGVPFLIYSGRRPDPTLPPELRQALWLEKPTAREGLLRAIASVTSLNPSAAADQPSFT